MTTLNTADDIRVAIDALELDAVASYFDNDDDEIDPYVVCEGVSIAALNEYVGDGEGLRIPLRFLALDDGRLVIVDLPTKVHESTAASFEKMFNRASGNDLEVASRGSMTARRAGNPNKEADATFGPKGSTLHRTPAPAPRTIADWVTLAVEVGRSQTWASLEEAAEWWCNYGGMQYILLLKISSQGVQMRYALYDIAVLGILPAPTASGTVYRRTRDQPAVNVTFNMRRILSIPANAALPNGVNATAVVDLRIVMNLVIDSLY
ncbi:Carboxy-terminal domain RNA polymerase II polypeptide A small phosphatase 1 [Phytophthora nicotianae]|uniref:Carboxy-terminal domain RNA polymerase II polypeptide A small phosphatase 1 n=1 Tax=Phytophthora nicotianae TaxID=4792 RepID=A0A0W8CEB7_PHYNI|nr:Carboxy-terminal domain RNA polymerase II polypeptide A small phosphatase 1 [Phytophthora nicotianae]